MASKDDRHPLQRFREQAAVRRTRDAAAEALDCARSSLQRYEKWPKDGGRIPPVDLLAKMAELYGVPLEVVLTELGVPRGTSATPVDDTPWPIGWKSRVYRLHLEAEEAGADEDELEHIDRVLLDPVVQNKWNTGKPNREQLKNLEGMEIGVRAYLRGRGRMVRAKAP